MSDPEQIPEPNPRKHELPPELQFLKQLSSVHEIPRDEVLPWAREIVAQTKKHADLIRQYGMDPQHLLAVLEPRLAGLETAQQKLDAGQDNLLHAAADVADAMRAVVDGLEKVVAEVRSENPFCPDLEQLEETLEQLRQEYPKLPDD